jgi:hypothetical protein
MSSSEEKLELKIDTPRRKSENNISEISEKTFNRKVFWKSCCFELDRRAVSFFTQLLISLLIITFCLFQLHTLDKCDSTEYLSLLTMVLGVWVGDAPRLN